MNLPRSQDLPFVAWMVLFLPLDSLGDYFDFLARGGVARHWSNGVETITAFVMLGIYAFVGVALWRRGRA